MSSGRLDDGCIYILGSFIQVTFFSVQITAQSIIWPLHEERVDRLESGS